MVPLRRPPSVPGESAASAHPVDVIAVYSGIAFLPESNCLGRQIPSPFFGSPEPLVSLICLFASLDPQYISVGFRHLSASLLLLYSIQFTSGGEEDLQSDDEALYYMTLQSKHRFPIDSNSIIEFMAGTRSPRIV